LEVNKGGRRGVKARTIWSVFQDLIAMPLFSFNFPKAFWIKWRNLTDSAARSRFVSKARFAIR